MTEYDVYGQWVLFWLGIGPVGLVAIWLLGCVACLASAPLANLLIHIFWEIHDIIGLPGGRLSKYD